MTLSSVRVVLAVGLGAAGFWLILNGRSVEGSAILAVALAVAVLWVPQAPPFAHFRVRITPLRSVLVEYGLATAAQLDALRADDAAHSIVRDGIAFTVLEPGDTRTTGLVFWNDFKTFSTKVDAESSFAELPSPSGLGWPGGEMRPQLQFKHSNDGLNICVASVQDLLRAREGTDEGREVAFLPWSEFGVRQWGGDPKRRDELLARHGWTRKEHTVRGLPYGITHRYFTVEWDYI